MLFIALTAAAPLQDRSTCTQVGNMPGPEDFAVLDDHTLVVSSDPRRTPAVSGAMVTLDLNTGVETTLSMDGRDSCSFHPHGIDLKKHGDSWHLYVVTHYQKEEAPGCVLAEEKGKRLQDGIEHFTLETGKLIFVERLQSPLLREPNDLVITEAGGFFVSDNPEFTTFGMLSAITLGRRPSVVLGYDKENGWFTAAKRMLYANGVLQPTSDWLWVATYGGHIWGYHLENGEWSRRGHTRLQGAMDNMMVGSDHMLYVASHPDPFAFLRHARDASEIAPSQIYKLAPLDDGWALLETSLEETGLIQASSTATVLGNKLLISQVFQPGIHVCISK